MIARSAGAAISQPGVTAVGRQPMSTVATPIVSSEATSVVLRPMRSPKWPKMIDPIGRAMNATPKTAKEARRAVAGSSLTKKSDGKTRTAAVA